MALHSAAWKGHTEIVKFLISKGYDVNAKIQRSNYEKYLRYIGQDDWQSAISFVGYDIDFDDISQFFMELIGKTPLHLSASRRHKDIVQILLKIQADIYIKDDTGATSLQIIIQNGMANILEEETVPLRLCDGDDYGPLHLGAKQGDLQFVEFCLNSGCSVNARSQFEDISALDLAVSSGHSEVVLYLVHNGADVNYENRKGITVLDRAVASNKGDIMRLLLKENVEMRAEKERKYLLSAIMKGNDDIIEYLLSMNPLTGALRLECNEYPLHIAVSLGHLNIVNLLLKVERKDINWNNGNSETPLQIASRKGYCEITRLLLSNGALPNMSESSPPLHLAIENGNTDIIEILLQAEKNSSLEESQIISAVKLAIKCRNLEIVETLLNLSEIPIDLKGKNGHVLMHDAVVFGCLQIVESLALKGASIHSRNSNGAKPIHIAAEHGYQDIVEYFLCEGLDIDDRDLSNFWSLMHYAAAGNQSDMCEFLIKNGLDVNIVDEHGCTPLHIAALRSETGVLHDLLRYGAYYDFTNKKNETPFDVAMTSDLVRNTLIIASLFLISSLFSAVQTNDIQKAEALLKEGLRFSEFGYANVKNAENVSLLHYAVWKGYAEIVELLLKYKADPNVIEINDSSCLHHTVTLSSPKNANELICKVGLADAEYNLNETSADYASDRDVSGIIDYFKSMFSKIRNYESFIDSLTQKVESDSQSNLVISSLDISKKYFSP